MEVLAHASLSRYSCIIGAPHRGICAHRMSLYAPWVDQARRHPRCVSLQSRSDGGANKFRCLPYFRGANGSDCPALSMPVVADQNFTKSVHRLARTYMLSQSVHSGGKHFAASIPRNLTIVRVTHYVSTCAGLQCKCSASGFIAARSLVLVPGKSLLKARHRPLFVP